MTTVITAVFELMPLLLALILLEPLPMPVTKPVLLIVATAVLLDVHTSAPKVALMPSVVIPLAVNCLV